MPRDLRALFDPSSVAVVGASLALALVCGLFTLRAAAEGPRLAVAPGSSREIAKGS